MMVHHLRPECRERLVHLALVAQVDAMNDRRRVDVAVAPGAEVVEDSDLMAGRYVCVGHVRADETGSAGDQDSHALDCNGFTWLRWLSARAWRSTFSRRSDPRSRLLSCAGCCRPRRLCRRSRHAFRPVRRRSLGDSPTTKTCTAPTA